MTTPAHEWTDDREELGLDSDYWTDPTRPPRNMAVMYGLASLTPILCKTRQSGDSTYLIESASKYYIWARIEADVWLIKSPTSKNAILDMIATQGVKGLELERLDPVDDDA